ncbi:MAG: hypothetical protein QM765_50340 [Myxococcales bacterium]
MARSSNPCSLAALCGFVAAGAILSTPSGAVAAGKTVEFATDACAKFPCRELTQEETAKMGRVLSKLMSLLPTPDAEKYEQRGLRASNSIGWTMVTDEMWQAANFPSNVVDTMALGFGKAAFPRSFALTYSYSFKSEGDRGKLSAEHVLENEDIEYFDIRIEVSAWPFAAPLEPGMQPGPGYQIKALKGKEKGTSKIAVIVGGSAAKKGSPSGQPGDELAPIKSVRILLQGPTDDVKALAAKIDRAALKAMVGPVDKVIGLK